MHSQGFEQVEEGDISLDNKNAQLGYMDNKQRNLQTLPWIRFQVSGIAHCSSTMTRMEKSSNTQKYFMAEFLAKNNL